MTKKKNEPKKKASKKLSKTDKKKLAEAKEDFGSPDALIVRSQSSVEVTRDKAGKMAYKVKVYKDSPIAAALEALEVAKVLDAEFEIEIED